MAEISIAPGRRSIFKRGSEPRDSRSASTGRAANKPGLFDRVVQGTGRSFERRMFLFMAAFTLIMGAMIATDDNRILGAAVGLSIIGLVIQYPPFASWILVAGTPFIVGVPRNLYLPLLRPNEVFLIIVCFALGLRWLFTSRRFTFKINRFEMAMLMFVFAGSVLPLVFTYGRLRPVLADDIFYSITLWKFVAIYTIVRITIRTPNQVRELLWVSLLASCAIGFMAVLDSRNIANFAFTLANYFPTDNLINDGRGAATIGNAIGLGGYMAIHTFIAFAMLIKGEKPVWLLGPVAFMGVFGTLGSGQTSGLIALVAGTAGFVLVTKSIKQVLRLGLPMMLVAGFMVYPIIEARVTGLSNDGTLTSYQYNGILNLPAQDQPFAFYVTNPGSSWDVRQYNLETFFLPHFEGLEDWLLGVSPQARVPEPDSGVNDAQWIWIESGHLWLFWIGGLPLFTAFMIFMFYGCRYMWKAARSREGPVAVAAIASVCAFFSLFVTQTFDPHITLRGSADIFWPLIALASVGAPAIRWFPEGRSMFVSDGRGAGYSRLILEDSASVRRREALQRLRPSLITRGIKRTFDVAVSGLALLVLAIPLLIIMAAIRLTSKGPAIFTQERVGLLEQPFTIYKLRTMAANNDDSEHREFVKKQLLNPNATADTEDGAFKLEDSRVTGIGSVLRRFSLDELPQLFNVLKGDMSLIGPRPALPWEVELFAPEHRMRSLVKPGCTGLWQVSGRNKLTSLQMLDLDVDYAGQVSMPKDRGILFRTPLVLVRGDGAR